MRTCGAPTLFRPCPQTPARGAGECYYHRKAQAGLLERPDQFLDETELETLMGGRVHGDGRRLDDYVVEA